MAQFPRLITKRLILDQIKPVDIPEIVSYAGNIKIVENTRNMPHPYHEEDAISRMNMANQGFKNRANYIFAMRFRDTLACIGGIGLTPDLVNNRAHIGYWLSECFWNLGFSCESVQAILQFGFKVLHLNKINAAYITTNKASGKVMIKNGMTKEAEFKDHDIQRDHTVVDDKYVSLIHDRMLKSEYELLTAKS